MMTAIATRHSASDSDMIGLYPLEAKSSVIDEDLEDDDYVIEDDLTDEEIAFMLKCVEEREKGLVKYIDFEDIDWGL